MKVRYVLPTTGVPTKEAGLSCRLLSLRPKLRPPLLGGSPDLRSGGSRHNALLYHFEFLACRIAQSFPSRSYSVQVVL